MWYIFLNKKYANKLGGICKNKMYRTYLDYKDCWYKDRKLQDEKKIIDNAIEN